MCRTKSLTLTQLPFDGESLLHLFSFAHQKACPLRYTGLTFLLLFIFYYYFSFPFQLAHFLWAMKHMIAWNPSQAFSHFWSSYYCLAHYESEDSWANQCGHVAPPPQERRRRKRRMVEVKLVHLVLITTLQTKVKLVVSTL